MSVFENKPSPLFELLVHDIGRLPGLTGAVTGYEQDAWRNEALADYIFEWLPEFALKYSDLKEFNSATGMKLMKKAARTVYTTEKYQKRGEFGEILLHALIREVFDSEPAISKIFYKSAANDTVKGFDAVHVVEHDDKLELWLGEVKFYKNLADAIREVVKELNDHTDTDYLRGEFILIESKIDSSWRHATALKDLISERKSLDEIFSSVCIPVLLTYESKCVAEHTKRCQEFSDELCAEIEAAYSSFSGNSLPDLKLHLFLVPLHNKQDLLEALQRKLKGLQQ